jgi:hypothetical protein
MIKTKHTYNLKRINKGKIYYLQLPSKKEAEIVCKTLIGMGFDGKGRWPHKKAVEMLPLETAQTFRYGMWIYPNLKMFERKHSNLKATSNEATNVYDENYFKRAIAYDIFRFVMVEKKLKNKNEKA